MSEGEPGRGDLLDASIIVPDEVVHREFKAQTVVLNLETGKYHSVNPMGGRVLELLRQTGSVRETAAQLSEHYGRPAGELESDVCGFCADLLERELIQVGEPGA